MSVVIETTIGDLVIDLYCDERPNCCKNFLKLCKQKYYNFCLFHNVQSNYVAQTGDPSGTGRGGESVYGLAYGEQAKYFDREYIPKIKHKKRGAVSMINNGDDKHGSQFLFTLDVNLDYLDSKHTVFGEVSAGFEVLDKFNECITDKDGRPFQDIRITHTVILDDPFDDIRGLDVPRKSPEPTDELLDSDRIRCDEDIDLLEGKTEEEVFKLLEERETQKRAKVLEIIGDIPDADVKPPENVLFVCKLNTVTTDEDLELIFSRFGPIKSCEVIRDYKTKESLCYAFIEFENEADCENAYFKMDNVLIDDRRIHVDFSQSVSKIVWKGKGTGTGQGFYENYSKDDDKDRRRTDTNYQIKDKSRKQHGYGLVFDKNDDIHKTDTYEKYQKGNYKNYDHESSGRRNDSYRDDRYRSRGDSDRFKDRDSSRDSRNHHHRDHSNKQRSPEKKHSRESERDRESDKDRDHKHRHHHKSRNN